MSDTDTLRVNPQIQDADADSTRNETARGNIGVHHGIEVVQKERAAISRNAMHLKPRFKRRDRAPETKDFEISMITLYTSVATCSAANRCRPRVKNAPKMTR